MFENLICEVKGLNERIIAECKENDEIKNLYKGCQIFYSPVKEKHEVMIIGINPGSGFYRYWKEEEEEEWERAIVQEFNPLLEHDYFVNNHNLAYHVKDVFEKANKIGKLENSIKTNFFFWATDNVPSLWAFIQKLSDSLQEEIWKKSEIWIKEIVERVSPQLIICEGTGATYKRLKEVFHETYIEEIEAGDVKGGKINNINVLAFGRTFSTIANKTKEKLIPLIEKYI